MWFLTPSREVSPASEWIEFVTEIGEDQRAELTAGTPKNWRQITIDYTDGSWSFDFERCAAPRKVEKEIQLFREDLEGVEPTVNAQWVAKYLKRVKTVYLFRCSINAPDTNMELVREIIDSLRDDEPSGLLYAELEGWSNEDGYHITWEFTGRVSGEWWMAIRGKDVWTSFQMKLGNRKHREAFKAGKVPAGLKTYKSKD